MLAQVKFWFSPSTETTTWFGAAGVALVGFLFAVRFLYLRSAKKRQEKELLQKLRRIDLFDRPEELVIREVVKRYEIVPQVKILSQLQFYDQVASDEIARIEKASMPLADRIDRIEYLYSIRLHAFSREPAVGGLDALLGKEEELVSVAPGEPLPEDEPIRMEGQEETPETPETPVEDAPTETGEESSDSVQAEEEPAEEEEDLDFAKLLEDPTLLGLDSEQEEPPASERTESE
jgi:hypothetical protein